MHIVVHLTSLKIVLHFFVEFAKFFHFLTTSIRIQRNVWKEILQLSGSHLLEREVISLMVDFLKSGYICMSSYINSTQQTSLGEPFLKAVLVTKALTL